MTCRALYGPLSGYRGLALAHILILMSYALFTETVFPFLSPGNTCTPDWMSQDGWHQEYASVVPTRRKARRVGQPFSGWRKKLKCEFVGQPPVLFHRATSAE